VKDLWRWGAVKLARGIRAREISSREAVESCLARIDAINPRINAIVDLMAGEALQAADKADAALKKGCALGVLHGVPVTLKINVDVAGRPTTNGVVAFKDKVPGEESPCVIQWRNAGAIFVGRTNVPAFSTRYFTDNTLHGRTLNPWDPKRTPGGSSGGAAAAVATGMGALAHGNDRAGSIRYPSYACGVYGLRPSLGRIATFEPGGTGDARHRHAACEHAGTACPLGAGPAPRHRRDDGPRCARSVVGARSSLRRRPATRRGGHLQRDTGSGRRPGGRRGSEASRQMARRGRV